MKKLCFFLSFMLLFALLMTSCMTGSTVPDNQNPTGQLPEEPEEPSEPEEPAPEKKTYCKVMVTEGEGFTVTSENPIEVEKGADAVFDITVAATHAFLSTSAGEFDQTTGKLTVKNVTKRTTVTFKVEPIKDEEVGKTYSYVFNGTIKDTTSIPSLSKLNAGTLVTVKAGDMKRNFLGWSFGYDAEHGGEIVATEREYTFRISADIADSISFVSLYANYSDANIFYYDLMGGVLNTSSANMADNLYYTAEYDMSGRVKITLLDKYFSYAGCASTFWDDGTFTKAGYILREYNTKADGSGEPYSLGSKYFPVAEDGAVATLYCIWEKADEASHFEYEDYTYAKPQNAKYATAWVENGIIITKYLSDEKRVVVPERIGDKTVIAIGEGAFTDKSAETVILPKTLQKISDGAFVSCSRLTTLYFPDGIYSVSDAMFDSQTYASFKNLIVNATMAPRYAKDQYGAFAVKFCRVLSAGDEKMIIFVAGSSTYQGLGTEYLEALLDGEYRVVNYGTTRTRPGYLYMEALAHYTDSDDIVVFAPENSAFMLGENLIKANMLLDLEGVNNLYRYIDFSKYKGYFSAFSEFNKDRYTRAGVKYEQICDCKAVNKYGDYLNENRKGYLNESKYIDAYYVTFNERIKSINEGQWSDVANQAANKDYTNPNNTTWTSLNRPELLSVINSAIDKVKATGARVYFAFAPTDANAIVDEARSAEKIAEYDALIRSVYHFDGLLGSALDYVYNHKYFYDCAYHVNDYGRTYRTYALYLDLAEIFGISAPKGIYDEGKSFEGCLFEDGSDGTPLEKVDFITE